MDIRHLIDRGNIVTRFGTVSGTVENGVCDYNRNTHKEEQL